MCRLCITSTLCRLYSFFTVSPEGGVVITPVGVVYEEGDNVTLMCTSLGGPDNSIQWLKDGKIFRNVVNCSSNTIRLIDISVIGDGAIYTCVASNAAGSGSADISLNIRPVFMMDPMNMEAVNGTEVSMMCTALAFPDPEYMWFRVGSDLPESAIGADTATLTLSPAVFGDHGIYYCTATSSGVTISSDNTALTS